MQTALLPDLSSFAELSSAALRGPYLFRTTFARERETVHIVDGDFRARESLEALLLSRGRSVITFASAAKYLAFNGADSAGCLILDAFLPDMNGLELQARLSPEQRPPIIFLSARADTTAVVRAMKAGAIEFLTKPVNVPALEAAIGEAVTRGKAQRRRQKELAGLRERFGRLTPREREVLPLVTGGLLNKQSAAELGISEVTLQVHRRQIMRKMEAGSFADLVRMAERLVVHGTFV